VKFSSHPVWLVGFRPFFALACLSGLALPMLWALIYSGTVPAPSTSFSMVQWHAHEMFFGFGWAVLGGFLLTATKNWVRVRGHWGYALMFLAAAWLFERAGMVFEGSWPYFLFAISNNLFLGAIVAMLLWTLLRNRDKDIYRDNYLFLLILPLFLISKHLMLSADYFEHGSSMALGLFRVAFLVMLERTLFPFMKDAFQIELLRNAKLNTAIKLLGLSLIFASFMPPVLAGCIALLLGLLLMVRFIYWKPQLAVQRLDIAIMYTGYLAIVGQLLIEFLRLTLHDEWPLSMSMHVFTFGAMGLIIPGMLVRISKGHTGRKVAFDGLDKFALWVMMLAFVLRIVAPLFDPADYTRWIFLAAACWFICFGILGWRYIPFLLQPRVDGKEH